MRYEGIRRGKEIWFDGRIMMNFKDADKNVLEPGPKPPSFNGTSAAVEGARAAVPGARRGGERWS